MLIMIQQMSDAIEEKILKKKKNHATLFEKM